MARSYCGGSNENKFLSSQHNLLHLFNFINSLTQFKKESSLIKSHTTPKLCRTVANHISITYLHLYDFIQSHNFYIEKASVLFKYIFYGYAMSPHGNYHSSISSIISLFLIFYEHKPRMIMIKETSKYWILVRNLMKNSTTEWKILSF